MVPGPDGRVKVMLVEDNVAVRRAVAALLVASGDLRVCAEAATVAEAGLLAEAATPDVVIVDLRLPDGSGVDAARHALATHPSPRVLLLTSVSEEEALIAAVLSGAAGYLLKQLLGTDLVTAVRAVAAGRPLLSQESRAAARERLEDRLRASRDHDSRLLGLVCDGRTNREISLTLGLDEGTVQARIAALASRLARRQQPPRQPSWA